MALHIWDDERNVDGEYREALERVKHSRSPEYWDVISASTAIGPEKVERILCTKSERVRRKYAVGEFHAGCSKAVCRICTGRA
jgi:hypothetical protein